VPQPVAGVKTGRGKIPSTSTIGGVAGCALMRAVDLFASSSSDNESVPVEPHRKHPQSSPPTQTILKPSDASDVEGTTFYDVCFLFI
jgi:hypothetical protein